MHTNMYSHSEPELILKFVIKTEAPHRAVPVYSHILTHENDLKKLFAYTYFLG